MLKRFVILMLAVMMCVLTVACGEKQENGEIRHGVSSEVNIDELPMRKLISGYAFETLTEDEDAAEAYVFFKDGRLYYIGDVVKTGTWTIEGDNVTAVYTSVDGQQSEETQVLIIALKSEIGITINGTEFMMADTAEGYIS